MLSTKPSLGTYIAGSDVRKYAVAFWTGVSCVLWLPLYVVKTVFHTFGIGLSRSRVWTVFDAPFRRLQSELDFDPPADVRTKVSYVSPGTAKCPEIAGYPEVASVLPEAATLGDTLNWWGSLRSDGRTSFAKFEPLLQRLIALDPEPRKAAIRKMIEDIAQVSQWCKFGVFATSLNASKDLKNEYRGVMHEIVEAWFDGVPETWPGRIPFITLRDKMRKQKRPSPEEWSKMSEDEQRRWLLEIFEPSPLSTHPLMGFVPNLPSIGNASPAG
ncbi:MAG: hypothetical protein LBB26_00255 [Puniceicoccales bacterium]|nr:hypothetical protein [Puniceicoccales bacterium]